MYIWALVFWAIAALMACWSFSLFVRLVSELFARRRTRLKGLRSNRSLWIGFALIFVCAAVAIASIAMALEIEDQYTRSYEGWTTPITIISGSVVLFGSFLIIWGLIGDRARGRKRCPKCWYDMRGATGLQCPECGRTVKDERGFGRSKRPRWAFVIAILMFMVSGYGFVINKHVTEHEEWLAAVPTWVLMAGWEWLPDDWILYDNSPYMTTLDERLDTNSQDSWSSAWISDRRIRRFGRKLCRGLETDQAARWDIRRMTLIGATGDVLLYKLVENAGYRSEMQNEWIAPPADPEQLFQASWIDLAEALVADPPTTDQIHMIEFFYSNYYPAPIHLANHWINANLRQQTPFELIDDNTSDQYWTKRDTYIEQREIEFLTISQRILSGQQHLFSDPKFIANFTSLDEYRQIASIHLLAATGALEYAIPSLLNYTPIQETMEPVNRAQYLGMMISGHNFNQDAETQLLDQLERLLNSGDPRAQAHALTVIDWFPRFTSDGPPNKQRSQKLYEMAIPIAVNNHTSMYPDQQGSDTFHKVGLKLATEFDTDGGWAYPLLLAELLADPKAVPDLPYTNDPFGSTANVQAWVENFAQLRDTLDDDVKEWLIENLPIQLGTPYDDLIDQIAVGFLDDPDDDIREMAEENLTYRFAENLITH